MLEFLFRKKNHSGFIWTFFLSFLDLKNSGFKSCFGNNEWLDFLLQKLDSSLRIYWITSTQWKMDFWMTFQKIKTLVFRDYFANFWVMKILMFKIWHQNGKSTFLQKKIIWNQKNIFEKKVGSVNFVKNSIPLIVIFEFSRHKCAES